MLGVIDIDDLAILLAEQALVFHRSPAIPEIIIGAPKRPCLCLFGLGSASRNEMPMSSILPFSRDSLSGESRKTKNGCSISIWVLILSNLLVFQLTLFYGASLSTPTVMDHEEMQGKVTTSLASAPSSSKANNNNPGWNSQDPLALPVGQAENLPSVRVQENIGVDAKRKIYGGVGDKAHLGGFTDIDTEGISPHLWRQMITEYGVHSVLDVGCGRGISTRWFLEHHVDVMCVEGSHDAVEKTFLPLDRVVEHDYNRGPWWPAKTYDAVWSIEFLEHVSRQYHFNYMQTFRKAALIFVSSSRWGGWHHVEVHPDSWWILKMEAYGFRYSETLTVQSRKWAFDEMQNKTGIVMAPNGKPFRCSHCINSLKVFVNPAVAALPQHQHLFPRYGCFKRYATNEEQAAGAFKSVTRPCRQDKMETALPESFEPLSVLPSMHASWDEAIKQGIDQ